MKTIILTLSLIILLTSCDFFSIQNSELKCTTNNDCKITEFCNNNRDCSARGVKKAPCFEDNTCNNGFTCNKDGYCYKTTKADDGAEGGNCYANGTCNENLVCNTENTCVVDLCLNITCKEWETCNPSNGNCDLISNRCATNGDCIGTEICSPSSHVCYNSTNPCKNINCGVNGVCINDNSSPKCNCQTGYNDNNTNLTCTESCVASECTPNGSCDDSKEEKFCICDTGYHPDGMTCIKDSEECTEGTLCDGLVAHYEFEDNANDSSGNNNNMEQHGGVTYEQGVIGKALSLDGVDDYLEAIEKLPLNDFPVSISFWMNIDNNPTASFYTLFSSDNNNSYAGNINGFFIRAIDTNEVWGTAGGGIGSNGNELALDNAWSLNNWTFITIIFKDITKIKMYKNGLAGTINSERYNLTSLSITSYKDRIGADYENNSDRFFNGLIDDLRIYNRALSETEITELYLKGTNGVVCHENSTYNFDTGICDCDADFHNENGQCVTNTLNDGLVAHYEFEDNANDSSGNNNNMEQHGGVTYEQGVIGKALSLDGVDDYLEAIEKLPLNDFPVSISTWVKVKGTPVSYYSIYSSDYNDNWMGKYNGFWIQVLNRVDYPNNITGVAGSGSSNRAVIRANNTYNDNTWSYLTVIFSASNEMSIYMNGVIKSTEVTNTNFTALAFRGDKDRIGSEYKSSNREYFKGLIDDLRIYNRALTQSEINELYQMGSFQ